MAKETSETEPQSLDVIYDLAIKRLDAQIGEIEGIDGKLRTNFWFASLVIGVLLTYLSIRQPELTTVLIIFISLSFLVYLSMLIFTLLGYRFAEPAYLPKVKDLRDRALFRHSNITKRAVLDIVVEQIEENRELIKGKVSYASWAFWLMFPEVVLVGVSLLILVIN